MKKILSVLMVLILGAGNCLALPFRSGEKMEKIIQTAGKDQLGEFAPEFAHYNDDVLFGENWNNGDIDVKTRCIVTVVSLMSMGITDNSLKYHLENAKKNGVTKSEIAAIITHNAFYAGWPKAWAVFNLAKTVWNNDETSDDGLSAKEKYARTIMFPIGEPNTQYQKYFTGQSYLAPISTEQVKMYNVTFEPKCRNNWHIHDAKLGGGQMLIGVGGRGYYQEWGKMPVEIKEGTVIHIQRGVKHWHGAAPNSWFSHIAIELDGVETSNQWLEPVTEEEYSRVR